MNMHSSAKAYSLILGLLVFVAAVITYVNFRQEVFSALAAGTKWVLVTEFQVKA